MYRWWWMYRCGHAVHGTVRNSATPAKWIWQWLPSSPLRTTTAVTWPPASPTPREQAGALAAAASPSPLEPRWTHNRANFLSLSTYSSPDSHALALILLCSIVSQKKSNSDSGSSSGGGDVRTSSGRRVWRRRKLVFALTKQYCLEFHTYLTRHGSHLAN
jgi:hypothetical protein